MEPTAQTYQQIERAIRRMAENFPADKDAVMTDIHLQVKPTSGELLAFDDNDEELTRVVVEQWIEAKDDDFYEEAAAQICHCLDEVRKSTIDRMSVMHGDATLLDKLSPRFDLVTANINRNILLQDMPRFVSVMVPKGMLILSGFYQSDCDLLTEKAKTLGLTLQECRHDGDWACMCFAWQVPSEE